MKIFLLLSVTLVAFALDNGLGRTPPMGWNSWNHYGCNISQEIVKKTADQLVSSGLLAKGYKYLNIDDCWQVARDPATGQIIADKTRFPSGMAKLAEYVHQKGLLFGLYSDAGTQTCQGRPGGYNYQEIDAKTYAAWKIDYLKYDNCHNEGLSPRVRYPRMRDALNKTGRPIFFSMCEWGREKPYEWAQQVGNSWRTTIDIKDIYLSFVHNLERQAGLSQYAGPGAWNDPDMLQVGNGGMTFDEYQSHFALWAALKAPLLIGCSLTNMSAKTMEILGNQQVIAINQDPLGKAADLLQREIHQIGFKQVWGGQLSGNRYVLVFFNRAQTATVFHFKLNRPQFGRAKVIGVRDVLAHQDVSVPSGTIFQTKSVKSHGVANYIFTLSASEQENLQTV